MKLYRFLSEEDTSVFCHKVSQALNDGWELYGSPTQTFDLPSNTMRCGQAVIKEVAGSYRRDLKLRDQ
ncbi:MAG: DUF1737 domain-containing protein [Rhodobacteraceae bacterium]|jgi:hypothetical protein|nr:DUF1737 domain-containing protein [Paracoccaceae bacterium]